MVFERERLLELAWGHDYAGDTRTVDVHVTWLRDKITRGQARIQTVWGIGYKLVDGAQLPAVQSATAAGSRGRPRRETRPTPTD